MNILFRNASLQCSGVIGESKKYFLFCNIFLQFPLHIFDPPPVAGARRIFLFWEDGRHLVSWYHPLLSRFWKVLGTWFFVLTWLLLGTWNFFILHDRHFLQSYRIPFEDENILSLYNKIRTQRLQVFFKTASKSRQYRENLGVGARLMQWMGYKTPSLIKKTFWVIGLVTTTSFAADNWAPASIFSNNASIILSNGLLCRRSPFFLALLAFSKSSSKWVLPSSLFQGWSLGISKGH